MSESTTSAGLARIGQIAVNVHDLKRAVEFYRDRLGMKLLFEVPRMAFFDCGGVRLMLGLPEKPEFDHPASIIYYAVEDIRAAHRALAAGGVEFREVPKVVHRAETYDLWLAFFGDSEGNLLALMSEVSAGRV
jgi:methylmalonyl-CoA/ethylmalonyl-CoA epimerase